MGSAPDLLAIDFALLVVIAWFALGLIGIAALNNFRLVGRVLFPASAASSLALAGFALFALPGAPQTAILAIGLPDPFHLRLHGRTLRRELCQLRRGRQRVSCRRCSAGLPAAAHRNPAGDPHGGGRVRRRQAPRLVRPLSPRPLARTFA